MKYIPATLAAMTLTVSLTTTLTIAQDLAPSAAPQDHPIFLVGATVHTISGDTIENGVVSFTNGTINIVGVASDIMPRISLSPDSQIIDLTGKHLYPGMIDSVTTLGLQEISAVRAMNDYNEVGDMTPEVRAYVSVNPDSTIIPTARSNGILTFGVFPTGGTIPGRASALQADGWTTEDMALARDAGLIINWPRMRATGSNAKRTRERRDRTLENINTIFDNATTYAKAHNATDLQLEAVATTLPGDSQNPIFINANDYDQITAAINWATSRNLNPIIVGGRDAHLCTDLLVSTDTPVIIGGTYNFPKRADAPYDQPYTLPAKLEQAGVLWSLTMSGRHAHERNLPEAIGITLAHGSDYGFTHEAALRGITLNAAKILGLETSLGSIESGKYATLFVSDDDILNVTSIVTHAWIQGRSIDLSNKQTDLRDKYQEKYRQLDMIESDN
ncbi:MAG: amidohydrolase family protein [Gammaproteobacteria bacterium]|nr:amidohydrolase family protein [Gammaproteobacteria bacterium]